MATNLAIDPDLLDRAVAVSGERTKTAAVKRALAGLLFAALSSGCPHAVVDEQDTDAGPLLEAWAMLPADTFAYVATQTAAP